EGRTGVGDLEVQHGVDLDDQVVLGDDRLRFEGDHLFTQVDEGVHPVDVRDDEAQSGGEGAVVAAEPLDVASACLRHDADGPYDGEDREERDDQAGEQGGGDVHGFSPGGRRARWRR